MSIIKSWMNDVVVRLANHGVQGRTRTLKFEPVYHKTGKSMATRPCKLCGYKHAVVFRGFEDKGMYLTACIRCKKFYYYNTSVEAQRDVKEDKQRKDTTNQCKGTTKKGTQCKGGAMPNGYCGVHQSQGTKEPASEGQTRAKEQIEEQELDF